MGSAFQWGEVGPWCCWSRLHGVWGWAVWRNCWLRRKSWWEWGNCSRCHDNGWVNYFLAPSWTVYFNSNFSWSDPHIELEQLVGWGEWSMPSVWLEKWWSTRNTPCSSENLRLHLLWEWVSLKKICLPMSLLIFLSNGKRAIASQISGRYSISQSESETDLFRILG